MKPGNQTSCGTRLLFWEGIDLGQWSVSLPGFKRQCLSRSSGCVGDEIVVWWPDRRRLLFKRGGLSAIGIKLRAKQVPERVRDGKWTAIFGDAS